MSAPGSPVSEALAAHLALEGLLPGVNQLVTAETRRVTKPLVANLACVRLLACVNPLMNLQMLLGLEPLTTDLTLVGFHVTVCTQNVTPEVLK